MKLVVFTLLAIIALASEEATAQNPKKNNGKSGETIQINVVKDSDGDGIPDSEDLCPDIPGHASAKGCPDSDSDGIPDFEDDCPNAPGLTKYKGCPDSDGDGIPDNKDVCPHEKGSASNNGCPLATPTDQPEAFTDSIADETIYDTANEALLNHYERFIYEQERKKNQPVAIEIPIEGSTYFPGATPGTKTDKANGRKSFAMDDNTSAPTSSNTNAAPKETDTPSRLFVGKPTTISDIDSNYISGLIKRITFERGRILLTSDGTNALNELSDILKVCYDWKVIFHCFVKETDNNYRDIQLSRNRGAAIKAYLVNKRNISPDRIDHKGYGNVHIANMDTTVVKSHVIIEVK